MGRIILLLLLLVFLFLPLSVSAQDSEPPKSTTASISDIDLNKDGKIDAAEAKALLEREGTVGGTVKEASAAVDAAKNLKGKSGKGLALAIASFLAILFKALLSLTKVMAINTGWFRGARGKAALKYTTLGLGVLAAVGAGVASNMGAGFDWMDIAIIAGSGPGSMVVHELMSLAPGVGKHASVPDPDQPSA